MRTKWMDRIEKAEKKLQPWRDNAKKIVRVYRGGAYDGADDARSEAVFNLHWSNVDLLVGTTYQGTPDPEVERRFKDNGDTIALDLALLLQQALQFAVEQYDFDELMKEALVDWANTGLGQLRVRYKPYIKEVIGPDGEVVREREPLQWGEEITGNGEVVTVVRDAAGKNVSDYEVDQGMPFRWGDPVEELEYEEVTCEFVPWDCFGWDTDARTWPNVQWAYIKHEFTKNDVRREFGDLIANKLNYGAAPPVGDGGAEYIVQKARVYEVFDKMRREVIIISPNYEDNDGVLKVIKDPYKLAGFFPFPKPMFGTTTSNKLIPVPYYAIVQDLFRELNVIQNRVEHLTEMLKVRGISNSAQNEALKNVFNGGDGHLEPIETMLEAQAQGGIGNFIMLMPLAEINGVLQTLVMRRESVKGQIYEVTGFSDLMRGQTKASETLGAQQLKMQFANVRMNKYVRTVNSFVRDVYRLKAELIAEHFQPETLSEITGQEVTPEAMAVLRSDILRAYKIDVQTETTAADDDEKELAQRNAFLAAAVNVVSTLVPLSQQGVVPPELATQLLEFGVRGFRKGRILEKQLKSINFAPPPPAPPPMAGGEGQPPPAG